MPFTIPDELVGLFREGRVIPFVGAGMSANVGYPSWDTLLKRLGANLGQGDLTHDQVVDLTRNDRLRIAEYYYLKEGKQVGPLRREIDLQFSKVSPLTFGGYVDLINLGAQRIYTTNFDDLIERTYRELELPFSKIATPRDLALSAGDKTEIVKYHGDLTNDPSLVLTESQYHRRLNFDSPMDLKFRADILGKSVMFIGYSFSDINIRIIWFRLLDMMRGVEQTDMPTSYMVIPDPNPVEELLYKDAGIETIVLDPEGSVEEKDKPVLVGNFLYELMSRVCDPNIPNSGAMPFVSQTLLRRVRSVRTDGRKFSWGRRSNPDMQRLATYRLPAQYLEVALGLFGSETDITQDSIEAGIALYSLSREDERIKRFLVRGAVERPGLRLLNDQRIDWESLEEVELEEAGKDDIISRVKNELEFHEHSFDADLFFAAYLAMRLSEGRFGATSEDAEKASEALSEVEERYPDVVRRLEDGGRAKIEEVAADYEPAQEEGREEVDDLPFK